LPQESALMRGENLAPHFLLSWQKKMRRQRWKRKPLRTHPAKKITCPKEQVIFLWGPRVRVRVWCSGNLQPQSADYHAGKSKVSEFPDTPCVFFRCRWPNLKQVSASDYRSLRQYDFLPQS
jgi:hypothetical protein